VSRLRSSRHCLLPALTIPARYLTVYAHELVPQDFHAVFEVFVDGKWFLIDGTRKAPLNGMVRLAIGRDASDAAVATLFGNVYGTAVKVAADFVSEKDGDEFLPVTRETLRAAGEAIYL
jgi:transglutaminase-like putative cysteine protease